MPLPQNRPPRIQIEDVWPEIDCGRYPVKRSVGDEVEVWATIFRDGHESSARRCVYRPPGTVAWQEAPMRSGNDRFGGSFLVTGPAAGSSRCRPGSTGSRRSATSCAARSRPARPISERAAGGRGAAAVLELDVRTALASTEPDRHEATQLVRRSRSTSTARSRASAPGTSSSRARGAASGGGAVLPELAELGFDVVYLPPIHPIGRTNRKGPNNALVAGPDDPGSPVGDRQRGRRPRRGRPGARHDRGLRPPRRRGRQASASRSRSTSRSSARPTTRG